MLAVAGGFAVLLGSAAWGKFRDAAGFEAILADYRLLPGPLVRPVARGIPAVEGVLAGAWIIAPWHTDAALLASIATAAIMLGYGVAIAANLARGRSWIDCGCGGGEQLSWILVGRNAVLATVAVVPLLQGGAGRPDWGDLAMALPVFAAGACLYLATGALVANAAAMRPWVEDPS